MAVAEVLQTRIATLHEIKISRKVGNSHQEAYKDAGKEEEARRVIAREIGRLMEGMTNPRMQNVPAWKVAQPRAEQLILSQLAALNVVVVVAIKGNSREETEEEVVVVVAEVLSAGNFFERD